MSIQNLKREIEAALQITNWSPTENHLHEISARIMRLDSSASKADIAKIVNDVFGSYQSLNLDGVDNTDLTTLLLLATKTKK